MPASVLYVYKIKWKNKLIFLILLCFLELQKLRQQVGSEIRSNQQLENDLNQMDIKIGLLIKNRITLQVRITF